MQSPHPMQSDGLTIACSSGPIFTIALVRQALRASHREHAWHESKSIWAVFTCDLA